MAFLTVALALIAVTAAHEAGHSLAVRVKGGRVRRLQVGRGPSLWRSAGGETEVQVSLIPLGGRIQYDGIPHGTGQAVVAVSGAAANLLLALVAFAAATWLGAEATPLRPADAGPATYAAASAGGWFWVVPGAVVELVSTGQALELRRALAGLVALVASHPFRAMPYTVGALSALWAALNLIPVPGLETDGWHVLRALWPRPAS
jgi:membrane-associated protease RseP (regulator of RpoE activity)